MSQNTKDAALNSRVKTNYIIDEDCVTININGMPNSTSNKRSNTNGNCNPADGFIYTNSFIEKDNEFYYNNEINSDSGVYSDTIQGGAGNEYTQMNIVRNSDENEAIINFKHKDNITEQFSGKPTDKSDFMYNEGNPPKEGISASSMSGKVEHSTTNDDGPGHTGYYTDKENNTLTLSYSVYGNILSLRNQKKS